MVREDTNQGTGFVKTQTKEPLSVVRKDTNQGAGFQWLVRTQTKGPNQGIANQGTRHEPKDRINKW